MGLRVPGKGQVAAVGHRGHAWHRLSRAGLGGAGAARYGPGTPRSSLSLPINIGPGARSQRSQPWAPADPRPLTGTLRAPNAHPGAGEGLPGGHGTPSWVSGWIPGAGVNTAPPSPAPPWPCQAGGARVSSPGAAAVPATSPGVQLMPPAGAAGATLLPPVTPPPSEGYGGLQPPRSEPRWLRDPRQLWDPRAEEFWSYLRAGTGRPLVACCRDRDRSRRARGIPLGAAPVVPRDPRDVSGQV